MLKSHICRGISELGVIRHHYESQSQGQSENSRVEGTEPVEKADTIIHPHFEDLTFVENPANVRFKRTAQPWGGWGGGWGWGK